MSNRTERARQIKKAEDRLSFTTGRMSSLGSDGAMIVFDADDPAAQVYRSTFGVGNE